MVSVSKKRCPLQQWYTVYIYICIYINFGENGWWISYLVDGSPPARWGSLDFIRVAFSFSFFFFFFFFFFFSSGSLRSQLRAPDLSVGTAGPQQALPDLNRERQISLARAHWYLALAVEVWQCPWRRECQNRFRRKCQDRCHKECQIGYQNRCQVDCQNIRQIKCLIECRTECQSICQNICQVESHLVGITRRKCVHFSPPARWGP